MPLLQCIKMRRPAFQTGFYHLGGASDWLLGWLVGVAIIFLLKPWKLKRFKCVL